MRLPENHPQRFALNDEVHARPPEALEPPLRLSFLALQSDWSLRETQWAQLCGLAGIFGAPPPAPGANHYSADFGAFRLKWERHTEFARYKFIVQGATEDPFAVPAIAAAPAEWVAALPGRVMVATNAALVDDDGQDPDCRDIALRWFAGNVLVGSAVAGGGATAVTDFRIHPDGFGRLLLRNRTMSPRQAGRTMQRILEIDTYRIMALLALPVARDLAPFLTALEGELVAVTAALVGSQETDEPVLLERLARLEAELESRRSANQYRFSAANAYDALVRRRIEELREERIQGLQTFQEFTERRLAPAMGTCVSVATRQDQLSERVARATGMLAARIDISRERQNQALLESMDRRARLQLRLQETVEGLSVAAISYYIIGLVGYAAKGLKAAGLHIDTDLAIAVMIPVVVALTALGMNRIHHMVKQPHD